MPDQTTPDPARPPTGPSPDAVPGTTPDEATPQPPRNRRAPLRLIIAGGLAVVLVVAGVVGYVLFQPQLSGEHPASLETLPQVAGLELSTDPALEEAAVQMSATMTDDGMDDEVAAFYTDPAAADRLVVLIGGTTLLRDPEAELDAAFSRAGSGGLAISGTADVDAGPLGGTARCGEATVEGIATAVCGWADHGSLVLGVFFNRGVDQSATLLREIRADILTR